jgi:hypothetical protein
MEGLAWAWQARFQRVEVPEVRINSQAAPSSATDRDLFLLVIGESSAVGSPFDPQISIGQLVAWQLERIFPGRRVFVDTRAVGGICLDDAVQTLSKPWRKPDAVLLYSGHNEFHARYELMREVPYYQDEFRIRENATRWLRRVSPLSDLILETLDDQLVDRPPAASGGRRNLVDSPAYTSDERARRLTVYQAGLKAFYGYCERAGALPILFVPASNDGGFEPNRSVLQPSTPLEGRQAFARAFQEARALEETDPQQSVARYRALLDDQPGFAETHFRLGRLLVKSAAFDEANDHFRLARDLDQFSIRCPGDFREACRLEASRHDGILIDAEAILRPLSPHGIMDEHLFFDAHHPNLDGYLALAEETLRQLHRRRAFGWPENAPTPSSTTAEVASSFELGASRWVDVCRWVAHWYESVSTIRFDPSDRQNWNKRYSEAARAIADGLPPERAGCPGIGIEPPAR